MIRSSFKQTWGHQEVILGWGGQGTWNMEQTLEEELRTLQAVMPGITEDVRSIFKEAVTDSLWNTLSLSEARALLRLIGEGGFENPCEVYSELDSILRGGSQILKNAIREEFRTNVHLLTEKAEKGSAADLSFRKRDSRQDLGPAESWAS